MAWLRQRSSIRWIFGLSIDAALFVFGIFFYIYSAPDLGVYAIGLSIFLGLILFLVPSLVFRRIYRRNSRIFGHRTVSISDTGIVSDHPLGHSETTWNMFERFRETKNLFLLYQSADLTSPMPKRVFANPAELAQFRVLLTSKVRSS